MVDSRNLSGSSLYRSKCLRYKRPECYNCGYEGFVEVHHIDGCRGHNYLDNLLPLCESCHKKVHSNEPTEDEFILKLRELLDYKVWEDKPDHPVFDENRHLPVAKIKLQTEACVGCLGTGCEECSGNGRRIVQKLNEKYGRYDRGYALPYAKTYLNKKWHSKLKHYRDENDFDKIDDAVESLLQQAIARYEHEKGELPDEYDKPDYPTWDRNDD